jgi:hypothetical protein
VNDSIEQCHIQAAVLSLTDFEAKVFIRNHERENTDKVMIGFYSKLPRPGRAIILRWKSGSRQDIYREAYLF